MNVLGTISPQGRILLIKFVLGIFAGVLASLTHDHLTGPQLFLMSLLLYFVVSVALSSLARQAAPANVPLGLYVFFKGFLTYYITLYLVWLTIYIIQGGEVMSIF